MKIFVSTQVTLARAGFCLCRRQLAHTCSQQIVLADPSTSSLPSVLDKVLHRSLAPPVPTEREMFTCRFSFGVIKKPRTDAQHEKIVKVIVPTIIKKIILQQECIKGLI